MPQSNEPLAGSIWARPEPTARQPRISRQQIAEAALGIADAEGFDAVTMRRIARVLGAGTMSLYRYITTKEDLLALVSDAVLGDALVAGPLPPGWRDALALVARQTRRAFQAHPWAIHVIQSPAAVTASRTGPNGLRHLEQSLAALASAPLDIRARLDLAAVLDDYVFGHLLRTAGLGTDASASAVRSHLASGELPLLTSAGAADLAAADDPRRLDDRFERGLRLLLDGITAALGQTRAELPQAELPQA